MFPECVLINSYQQRVLNVAGDDVGLQCAAHIRRLHPHPPLHLSYCTFVTPLQCGALHIFHASSVCCVTHLSHLVSALNYTFLTPRPCVALRICHTSSVRCITHLSRLVRALRYAFRTPCQLQPWRHQGGGGHEQAGGVCHFGCARRCYIVGVFFAKNFIPWIFR
jgi:hypothetical protein